MPQAAVRHRAPKAVAIHSPEIRAIERLAQLAAQGVAAHRMKAATRDILADWRSEGIEPDELRERLDMLATNMQAGQQAAADCVAEAETEGSRAAARRQVEALGAVRGLVVAEAERV